MTDVACTASEIPSIQPLPGSDARAAFLSTPAASSWLRYEQFGLTMDIEEQRFWTRIERARRQQQAGLSDRVTTVDELLAILDAEEGKTQKEI